MMSIETDYRPYAPPTNVVAVIQRVRSRNTPPKIDAEFLNLVGVPNGSVSRVLTALEFLNLVDEEGVPTDTLDSLGGAGESDYRSILEGVVKEVYAPEFSKGLDPAIDPQSKIEDYFAPYQPRSQTTRMAVLFVSLCREAGMEVLDKPKDRQMRERVSPRAKGNRAPSVRRSTERQLSGRSPAGESNFFGLAESDLARLSDDDFDTVWAAIGTIVKTKVRSSQSASGAKFTADLFGLFGTKASTEPGHDAAEENRADEPEESATQA